MPQNQRQIKMSPTRYAVLMRNLFAGEYSCSELAKLTGLHYITVLDYCRSLHTAGLIYIVRWDRDDVGRDSIMVYKWGPGQADAIKRKLTRAQQQQRYRARKQMRSVEAIIQSRIPS